jgi:hypothetical protein
LNDGGVVVDEVVNDLRFVVVAGSKYDYKCCQEK